MFDIGPLRMLILMHFSLAVQSQNSKKAAQQQEVAELLKK